MNEEMTPTQFMEENSTEHPLMDLTNDESMVVQQFPAEIAKQLSLLADLQKKKDDAWEKAQKAQEAAEQMNSFVTKKFFGHEYKSGDKTKIITDTQNVVKLVADSEKDLADAQKISYDFQEALSKSTELLFGMGCTNIAANEAMIDQIVSIRDNKRVFSKFQLTEDVKERILGVAKRLKAHQDLLRRQASHEERIKRQFADWKKDYDETLTKKQDIISDLDTIRTNSEKGAKALQPCDIPAWAKAPQKPEYTAKEVHALPDNTKIPTKVSELTNDKGYLTEHQSLNAYATTEWVKGQNYLTTHQDISMKAEQTALDKYMRWTIASLIIGGLSLLGVVTMFLKLFFDIF